MSLYFRFDWTRLCWFSLLAGLYVCFMLAAAWFLGEPVPCGPSDGCQRALDSEVSSIYGIPLSVLGFAAYSTIVVLLITFLAGGVRALGFAYLLATLSAVISFGLTAYLASSLDAICPWCMASNVLFCVAAFSLGMLLRNPVRPKNTALLANFMMLELAIVVVISAGSAMWLANRDDPKSLDPEKVVGLGLNELWPPDAIAWDRAGRGKQTLIAFIDLQCPTCHAVLRKLIERATPDRNVVVRHFPLKSHRDAAEMAHLTQTVAESGLGREFVKAALKDGLSSLESYMSLARKFSLPAMKPSATSIRRVAEDLEFGARLGVRVTPTILLWSDGKPTRQVSPREALRLDE